MNQGGKSARELRLKVRKELQIASVEVWQDKPYTAVKIIGWFGPDGVHHDAVGFSKVRFPDTWDADKGVEIATRKAIGKIVESIVDTALEGGD